MKTKIEKTFKYFVLMILMASMSTLFLPMRGLRENEDNLSFSMPNTSTLDINWPSNSSEWTEIAPEEQLLNSSKIFEMYEYLENWTNGLLGYVQSVIIIRNGYLLIEEYLHRNEIYRNIDGTKSYYGGSTIHDQASTTKSLMSILIGIALQEGFLDNVSQTLFEFFSDTWEPTFVNSEQKKNITIEHLLTMNSGLVADWDPFYPSDFTNLTEDCITFTLNQVPLGFTPGETEEFTYSNDGPNLLSGIITKATGKSAEEFAEEYLFTPLGITEEEYFWWNDSKGIDYGGYAFSCSPKVQAKLGMLCLNNGNWNGTQIVDPNYMNKAFKEQISGESGFVSYGYLFYTDGPFEGYYTYGAGGQSIYVIPQYNIVVCFTGSGIGDWFYEDLIMDYIVHLIPPPPDLPEDQTIPGYNLNMISLMILFATAVLIIKRKK